MSSPDNKISVILSDPEQAKRVEGESKDPDAARITPTARTFLTTTLLCITTLTLAALAARAELEPWLQSAVSDSAIEVSALPRRWSCPACARSIRAPPAEARKTTRFTLVVATPDCRTLRPARPHRRTGTGLPRRRAGLAGLRRPRTRQGIRQPPARRLLPPPQPRRAGDRRPRSRRRAALHTCTEKFLPCGQAARVAHLPARALGRPRSGARRRCHARHLPRVARPLPRRALRSRQPHHHTINAAPLRRRPARHRRLQVRLPAGPGPPASRPPLCWRSTKARSDATARALTLFDQAWQPLWPGDLVATYFQLLSATHMRSTPSSPLHARQVTAESRRPRRRQQTLRLLPAAGSQGRRARTRSPNTERARTHATQRGPPTNSTPSPRCSTAPDSLRMRRATTSRSPPHPAISVRHAQSPEEAGLTGLIHLLLSAPDSSIELGAGNLSLYQDIATLDRGPGYLNGILSLWLNSQNPASEFHDEEQKATPYFHREKAAELLAVLDQRFPSSAARAELHAELIRAYHRLRAGRRRPRRRALTSSPTSRTRPASRDRSRRSPTPTPAPTTPKPSSPSTTACSPNSPPTCTACRSPPPRSPDSNRYQEPAPAAEDESR
jgi:hypothetical protein